MGDGVFELRTTFGSDTTRIFYFFVIGKQVVLINGFIKKSQKTPKRELEKARISKKETRRNAMATWTLNNYIETQLQDPNFKNIWVEGEGEYQAQRALIEARSQAGLSQRELSRLSGVPQKTISLIESADTNTTVETLNKLAGSMGKILTIRFEDPDDTADHLAAEA